MPRICSLLSLAFLLACTGPSTPPPRPASRSAAPSLDTLRARLRAATTVTGGRVGVAVALLDEAYPPLLLRGEERFHTQSVFKLPTAMAVLAAVDRGELSLDQLVEITSADFVSPRQHSPIRRAHPNGVTLPLAEVIEAAAGNSDGTAADVLLRLIGGPAAVTAHLRGLGIDDWTVGATEREMGSDPEAPARNWTTPLAALQLLLRVEGGTSLSTESHDFLLQVLRDSRTGEARLRAGLPPGTPLAHKTGTAGTNDGFTAATNDIGLVTLPDGRELAIAVFVADSRADAPTREGVIAAVARLAYDFFATPRTIAITVDDLPGNLAAGRDCDTAAYRVLTERLTAALAAEGVVATGFVNESKLCEEHRAAALPPILRTWLDAGHDLGNHTYSHRAFHADLTGRPDPTLEEYERELLLGERYTRAVLAERGRAPRYFRHPYLRTGPTGERKDAFEALLAKHGYEVAPVTVDNSEWMFAGAYQRALAREDTTAMARIGEAYLVHMLEMTAFFEELSVEVVGREIPQVLLIHANALNAAYADELLAVYRARGYRFVPLAEALVDDAYARGDVYTGSRGRSWLQRWRYAQVGAIAEEPTVPAWITDGTSPPPR